MTLLATIGLLGQLNATPCPPATTAETDAALVVQAVDQLWLPLPGAKISAWSSDSGPRHSTTTDKDGFARFVVPGGTYKIAVELIGFKPKTVKRVDVTAKPGDSVPHVQVQLRINTPEIIE